jgi:hypothetical protein
MMTEGKFDEDFDEGYDEKSTTNDFVNILINIHLLSLVSEERSYFVSREISRGCPAHN